MLEVVHAKCNIYCVEKALAESIIWEHKKIAELHHFKAKQSEQIINDKDLDIRWINMLFHNYGQSQLLQQARLTTSPIT